MGDYCWFFKMQRVLRKIRAVHSNKKENNYRQNGIFSVRRRLVENVNIIKRNGKLIVID